MININHHNVENWTPKSENSKSKKSWISAKVFFPALGFFALVWMLIRIIPKPSRAHYPCMRAAFPLASAFITYVGAWGITWLGYHTAKKWFSQSKYWWGFIATVIFLWGIFLFLTTDPEPVQAEFQQTYHVPNQPMGQAKGIFPGRVVWVHNPDATRDECIPGAYGHGWFLNENNNQEVIDSMLSQALRAVTGQDNDEQAWEAIFHYYNEQQGFGNVGYQAGQKIFIKINATSAWSGNIDPIDLSKIYNQYYGVSETSPHLVLAMLRQLVNKAGIPQERIYIGDPMKHIYKHCYDLWHPEFPNVHYLDHNGWAGREPVQVSQTARIFYSDRGAVLRSNGSYGTPIYDDFLYTIFEETDYLINIPTLKGHKHAGMTAFPKNHFGSHSRDNAYHLHGGLVAPEANNPSREGYGLYRVQMDLMGHYLLGKKNLIYVLDGLWTSDYEIDDPDKWWMTPFNNDWMSSIFVSLDPVAIESVGFDFLRSEFTPQRGLATYPQMIGVDDYLHQAADSTCWPDSLIYDPENDGTRVSSLGVHEHWNDPVNKQYTRNLGTGDGIELIQLNPYTGWKEGIAETSIANTFTLNPNFPNPFNSTTRISYRLFQPARVEGVLFNVNGQKVLERPLHYESTGIYSFYWNGTLTNGQDAPSGIYLYCLTATGEKWQERQVIQMMLIR